MAEPVVAEDDDKVNLERTCRKGKEIKSYAIDPAAGVDDDSRRPLLFALFFRLRLRCWGSVERQQQQQQPGVAKGEA